MRGATRSAAKGQAMLEARPESTSRLDFVTIDDFEKTGVFDDAVEGIDAVIHVASVSGINTPIALLISKSVSSFIAFDIRYQGQ